MEDFIANTGPNDDDPDDGGYRMPNPNDRGIASFFEEAKEMKFIATEDSKELSHLFN